jgi:hypothetical protein
MSPPAKWDAFDLGTVSVERLLKSWIAEAGLDPKKYGIESLTDKGSLLIDFDDPDANDWLAVTRLGQRAQIAVSSLGDFRTPAARACGIVRRGRHPKTFTRTAIPWSRCTAK